MFICFPRRRCQVLLVTITTAFFPRSLFEPSSWITGQGAPVRPGLKHVSSGGVLHVGLDFSPPSHSSSPWGEGGSWARSPLPRCPRFGLVPSRGLLFQRRGGCVGTLSPVAGAGYTVSPEAIGKELRPRRASRAGPRGWRGPG